MIETVWLELYPSSPSTSLSAFFESLIQECDSSMNNYKWNLMLIGDFDINYLQTNTQSKLDLVNFCQEFHFSVLETGPTRITRNSSSMIDLILVNNTAHFRDTSSFPFSGSNHNIIYTSFFP